MPKTNKSQLKLIDCATDIRERRSEKRDAAYMVKELLLCTLPHRDLGDVKMWRREDERGVLMIQPGFDRDGRGYGIPFGSLPRLLLYWMVTEAKRTKSPHLELLGEGETARSYAAFMRELGLDPSRGGDRSDFARLRDQMNRLFTARIVFWWPKVEIATWENDHSETFQVTSKRMLWWNHKTGEQGTPSWIEIGAELYRTIEAGAVPSDMRALQALKDSPLKLDMYGMLNYFGVNKPRLIKWKELMRRLGTGYKDVRNFRVAVRDALPSVLIVHPGLRAEIPQEGGGLLIYPSEPAIPRREQA